MKQVYPTFIFNTNDGSEYPFLVCVPDMDIMTEGNSFADAIGVTGISMEDNKEVLPVSSEQNAVIEKAKQYYEDVNFSNGVLTYVDINFTEYRKKVDTKTVRRNVALPSWLNYEAEHSGINVSRVLQEALISTLHLEQRM
jgi:hypothetical protein